MVAKVLCGCHIVAMWLLGCCGWLPGNCYVITRVLLMWLPGRCCVVARVLCFFLFQGVAI